MKTRVGVIGALVFLNAFAVARPASAGSLVTAACGYALGRSGGEVESLYPNLARLSDEDFVVAVTKIFRPKLSYNSARWLKDQAVREFYPRRVVAGKRQKYFRTFRLDDDLGRSLLKTRPPTPSSTKSSPIVNWVDNQRTYGIYRHDKVRRRGIVQVWVEPAYDLGSGASLRTRVFVQGAGGGVRLLSDESDWIMTDSLFLVPF